MADQTTYMSINSVSRTLLPYYGPLAGANTSPTAGSAPLSNEAPPAASTRDTVTLRQARTATEPETSGESNSENGRNAPAINLYRRVSQYSDDRSSASGLIKSWNEIVRENRFEDAGVASYVKASAQSDAAPLPSRVLHLTA